MGHGAGAVSSARHTRLLKHEPVLSKSIRTRNTCFNNVDHTRSHRAVEAANRVTRQRVPLVTPATSGGRPIQGDFPLDQVVIDKLPLGTQVHSCNRHGASEWTVTAKIETTRADGEPESYFLKCADGDQGKAMLEGEYNSMCELYKFATTFVPKPHAYGQLNVSNPSSYFFLCAFLDMNPSQQAPDTNQVCQKLVSLHHTSKSPTGHFGFHINTCQGNLPQKTGWQETWKALFTQLLNGAMKLNHDINGPWKDLQKYTDRLISHVVPLLLDPLTSHSRVIKPTLIHGDLWDGNISIDTATGGIYIFDASAYYAHYEMEIDMWRGYTNKIMGQKIYTDTYLQMMGVSEPVDGFEDRGRLYSVYMNLHASACHGGSSVREQCYGDMKYLIGKYAPFVEELEEEEKREAGA